MNTTWRGTDGRLTTGARLAIAAAFVAPLAMTAWFMLDFRYSRLLTLRPGTDQGTFASIGAFLLRGDVPYRDIFESKPAGIFVLNALAMAIWGQSIDAVRLLERAFLVAGVLGASGASWAATKAVSPTIVAAVTWLLLASEPRLLEGGNRTEEFAIVFAIYGIWSAIAASQGKRPLLLSACSGLLFGIAVQTKEPFVLGALAWMALLLGSDGRIRAAGMARGALFAAAGAIPLIATLAWLAVHGAFLHFFDYLSYNFQYPRAIVAPAPPLERWLLHARTANWEIFGILRTVEMLCLAALVTAVKPGNCRRFAIAAAVDLLLSFVGAGVSPARFHHYYLQLVPAMSMLAAFGTVALARWAGSHHRWRSATALAAIAVTLVLDWGMFERAIQRARLPYSSPEPGAIANAIRRESAPGDRIWVSSITFSSIYLESALPTASRWSFLGPMAVFDTMLGTAEAKKAELARDITVGKPRFVVLEANWKQFPMVTTDLIAFIEANYEPSGVTETNVFATAELWRRR